MIATGSKALKSRRDLLVEARDVQISAAKFGLLDDQKVREMVR